MRSNKNSLKQSIIQVRNTIIMQEIDELKNRKNSNAISKNKISSKIEKEEKVLRNAYKNVINVITNLLDNIEDEKTNGKVNYIGSYRKIDKIKNKNKRPIKKLVSYDIPRIKLSLDTQNTKGNMFEAQKMNTLCSKKSPFNLSINWKSQKQLTTQNNAIEGSSSDISCSSMLSSDRKNQPIIKKIYKKFSKQQNKNLFFNPKNKLISRWNSTKDYSPEIPSIKNRKIKKPIINKSSLEININNTNSYKYSSAFSSYSPFESKNNISKSKEEFNSSSFEDSTITNNNKENNTSNTITTMNLLMDNKNETNVSKKRSIEPMSPFNNVKVKVQTSGRDESPSQNIGKNIDENKTSEITSDASQVTEELLNMKKKKRIEKMLSGRKSLNKIISLKSLRSNISKTFNKEKKFRCLLSKGYVYDSLDDEEESDQEDINNCYLEPNSIFLYILDTMTLISSFIILFYLPIYLSKRLFFCQELKDNNNIIFYFIDLNYIIDLFFNFYRSYYNFEEILVKKNTLIFIHYFKTWLFLDLISSIPIFSILKSYESKCIGESYYYDYKLKNNGSHSHNYNINLNNMHYILLLIKVIKTFKIFRKNIALNEIRNYFYKNDFLNNWGDVFLYTLFFFSFLNFTSCIFIFLGRNIIDSWIFLSDLETKSFIDIYICSVYYLIMTVTTVGYGDVIGKSISEIIFQIIMVIAGTCIYSWLITSVSNYVKKMNEKNIKYEEKIQILEEIKLSCHVNEKLYNKILRLLNYRKYHEEESEKNIILESLPNSLKNTLIIEMYKAYINGFSFFKDIENKEFIVQIISKLNPIIGIKGDILIQEGEYIEEIIFIKDGTLSLELWIDMYSPEESIRKYLEENGFINLKKQNSLLKSSTKVSKCSTFSQYNDNNKIINTTFNHYFEKIHYKNERAVNEKKKKLKVLEIRKNEHFGDVFMFLNKKSPLYVRVSSRKVDLLFLKKLDAISISDRYPDIWKMVIKKPLENSKMISNLTLKTLAIYCNINGIKTKLFKKKNKNKNFPKYYLLPKINKRYINSIRRKKTKNLKKYLLNKKENNNTFEEYDFVENKDTLELSKNSSIKFKFKNDMDNDIKNVKKKNNYESSSFTFNNYQNSNKICSNNNLENKLKSHIKKPIFEQNEKSGYKIFVSKLEDNEIKENDLDNNDDYSNNNNENLEFTVNNEILPNENFNINLYEDEKIKEKQINIKKVLPDNIYINNLNINYLGVPLEQNNKISKKEEKNKFKYLSISSESTLEINSSYENINVITSYKYISDNDLRIDTKNYLLERSKISISKLENINYKKNYSKFLSLKNNTRFFKSTINYNNYLQKKKNFEKKKSFLNIRKTCTKQISNQFSYETLNDFQNKINKSDKYNNILGKTNYSGSFDFTSMAMLRTYDDKSFDRIDSMSVNENDNLNFKKKKLLKKSVDNNLIKKKKRIREMEIISSNIEKSSQNLNHPELFYAGLFNNLITKNYPHIKENHLFDNKNSNHSLENDIIKEAGKESEQQENYSSKII